MALPMSADAPWLIGMSAVTGFVRGSVSMTISSVENYMSCYLQQCLAGQWV